LVFKIFTILENFVKKIQLKMMTDAERVEFLSECESQFSKRYTDQDTEYARITKPDGRLPPPVIPDWPAEKPRFNQNRGYQQNYQVITTFFL
jgi:hypothetical protein